MTEYIHEAKIFKVLSEPIRLQILELLSEKELCACEILKSLSISQSTLSHHMKVLIDSSLVSGRKDATWMFYSLNRESVEQLHLFIDRLTPGNKYSSVSVDCSC